MSELQRRYSQQTELLAQEAFGGLGCKDCGITVLQGAKSWGAHETGKITLPGEQGPGEISIAYDERYAPYPLGPDGRERDELLLSLADEGDLLVCAWALVEPHSPLRGIGVDLASNKDFDEHPAAQRYIKLLFTEREQELAPTLWSDNLAGSYAALFGAKEAAFKACAHPLRLWYRQHSQELVFEVRHFSAVDAHTERGEQRDGAAQRALDAMSIERMAISSAPLDDKALVVACALSPSPA